MSKPLDGRVALVTRATRGAGRGTASRSARPARHRVLLAIDTHLITSHFALPLLIREPGGLVVEMTDGNGEYNAERYRLSEAARRGDQT